MMRSNCGARSVTRAMLAMAVLGTAMFPSGVVRADDDDAQKGAKMELAGGRLTLAIPDSWQRRRPQTRIVEHEFAAPAAEGDPAEARITVMGAGGGIQANIDRWIDQFAQPDGSASKDKTKVEKKEVAGTEVYLVSITGTYKDRPGGGPFTQTPVVMREDYRMLSAIIATRDQGHYFIKMYGPRKTVDAQQEAFEQMVASVQAR
jgi:hypothetical protein